MTDHEKLMRIIGEIPALIDANISASDPQFQAWKAKTERFLIGRYGEGGYEHTRFKNTHFSLSFFPLSTPQSEFVEACQTGLRQTQAILQTYLDEMEEESADNERPVQPENFTQVFIVHGHDGELKQSVARIIEKQGIEAIILSEQANQGKTIIEKFIENSDVGAAICLFTADDVGKSKSAANDTPRARQNVVFETGYFIGRLGRDRTIILADSGIEIPSDLSGVVYTSTTNWKIELLKELKAIGYTIDFNKLF